MSGAPLPRLNAPLRPCSPATCCPAQSIRKRARQPEGSYLPAALQPEPAGGGWEVPRGPTGTPLRLPESPLPFQSPALPLLRGRAAAAAEARGREAGEGGGAAEAGNGGASAAEAGPARRGAAREGEAPADSQATVPFTAEQWALVMEDVSSLPPDVHPDRDPAAAEAAAPSKALAAAAAAAAAAEAAAAVQPVSGAAPGLGAAAAAAAGTASPASQERFEECVLARQGAEFVVVRGRKPRFTGGGTPYPWVSAWREQIWER